MKIIDRLPKPVQGAYGWMSDLFKEYGDDNGGVVAAAISFYIFISIIPLILVAVAVFGFVLGSQDQSREMLFRQVEQVLPGKEYAAAVKSMIGDIVSGSTPAGIIGFILLLWSGSSTFVNLGIAMDIAWDSTGKRGFILQRLVAIGVLLAAGLLLIVSFGFTTGASLLQRQEILGYSLGSIPFIWQIIGYITPPIITIAMFTLIYKVLPTARVPYKAALVGGVFAGVIWELLKIAFTFYLTHYANFGAIYGSLATVIILILWIYYSSNITVLGAEASQLYARKAIGMTEGQKTDQQKL